MEIHRAPGPPRLNVVVVEGCRVASLEVAPGRRIGAVRRLDGDLWTLDQPPGSDEWWVADRRGGLMATVEPEPPFGERFTLTLGRQVVRVMPRGGMLRRRWDVLDDRRRVLIEVSQRPLCRPVHDLRLVSGDVPLELPLLTAWLVALVTSPPVPVPGPGRAAGPRPDLRGG